METIGFDAAASHGTLDRPGIPGYELLEEIGRGGMGVVYKARQIKINRIVALKMILSGAHAGAAELSRFRTEAEAIGRLQHPNIVQVHEVDEHHGTAYLSLEYVDGGTLAQKLAGKPQSPRQAAHLLMMLARAVEAAHQAKIIHRDLKPGNILLASVQGRFAEDEGQAGSPSYGMPKITDFGLAKQMGQGSDVSVTGAVLGTPSYMSPEQAEGRTHSIGPPTDIYALGAILYEMLTGRPPFQAATPLEIVCQVVSDEPVRPTLLAPRVPRDLETICLKCLRKEIGKRYTSAADLADDLHRFLQGEPIRARPTPWWERGYKWLRRHPTGAALIGVTSLAALILVVVGVIYNARLKVALERAESQTEENRRNLVRVHVVNGVHRMDEGDGFAALVWFTEALRLDQGRPDREKAHRLRIASVLRQCPKLVELWAHKGAVRTVRVSYPDGKSVLSAGDDGARLWTLEGSETAAHHLDCGALVRGAVQQRWSLDRHRQPGGRGKGVGAFHRKGGQSRSSPSRDDDDCPESDRERAGHGGRRRQGSAVGDSLRETHHDTFPLPGRGRSGLQRKRPAAGQRGEGRHGPTLGRRQLASSSQGTHARRGVAESCVQPRRKAARDGGRGRDGPGLDREHGNGAGSTAAP